MNYTVIKKNIEINEEKIQQKKKRNFAEIKINSLKPK